MSEKAKKRIRLIYGLVLSVLLLTVGVCLIVSCLDIYQSGDAPYTTESIAAHFRAIAIPVWLCIAGVVGGIILALAFPVAPARRKGAVDPATSITRLMARVDAATCDPTLLDKLHRKRLWRRVRKAVAAAVCVAAAIPSLVYLLDLSHFTVDTLNQDIIAAMMLVLPCTAVALAACVAVTLWNQASLRAELVLVKEAAATAPARRTGEQAHPAASETGRSGHAVWLIRGAVAIVALVFIVAGIVNGGMADVLAKAVRICTECIGLG